MTLRENTPLRYFHIGFTFRTHLLCFTQVMGYPKGKVSRFRPRGNISNRFSLEHMDCHSWSHITNMAKKNMERRLKVKEKEKLIWKKTDKTKIILIYMNFFEKHIPCCECKIWSAMYFRVFRYLGFFVSPHLESRNTSELLSVGVCFVPQKELLCV